MLYFLLGFIPPNDVTNDDVISRVVNKQTDEETVMDKCYTYL